MGSVRSLGLIGLLVALCAVTVLAATAAGAERAEDRYNLPSIYCNFRQPDPIARYSGCDANTTPDHLDVAVADDGTVHVVFIGEGQQVLYSRRVAGEAGFRAPLMLGTPGSTADWTQVEVAPNGTVHIIWVERSVGVSVISWGSSLNGGDNWTFMNLTKGADIGDLSLAVHPDGTPAMVFTLYAYISADARLIATYSLEYFMWDMEGRLLVRTHVRIEPGPAWERPRLSIVGDGTVHCFYLAGSKLAWWRSIDGGRNWEEAVGIDLGPQPTGEYRVAPMSMGRFAVVWTGAFSPDGPGGATSHVAGRQLSYTVAKPDGYDDIYNHVYNVSSHYAHPSAFDLTTRGDEFLIIFLGFPRNNRGEVVTEGYIFLCMYSIYYQGPWGSGFPEIVAFMPTDHVFNSTGTLEEEYGSMRLAMCLERGPDPVVVASLLTGQSNFDVLAWRGNHAPSLPGPISEVAGGWHLGSSVKLEVEEAFDLDGDKVWYKLECWSLDGEPMTSASWSEDPSGFITGLRHGAYFWGVTVRDGWDYGHSSSGSWWFRVDTGPPTANVGPPYSAVEGGLLSLYGGRSRDDGPIVKWEWDWDGDGTFNTAMDIPRLDVLVDIEGRWYVTLRVTDETGQTDTDSTIVDVTHVPPDVTIVGPANVAASDTPYPYEVAIEPVLRHIYSCEWFVDDAAPVRGAEVWLFFREIGTHELALRVTDELGRPLNGQLTVTAHWTGPAEIRIIAPSEVFVGETYQVRAVPVSLNESARWTFSWSRDGEPVGEGRYLELVAVRAPSETVEVRFTGSDGSNASAEAVIVVLEHLTPPTLWQVGDTTTSTVRVAWTVTGQPAMFVGYIVRISTVPLFREDWPDLGWMNATGGIAPHSSAEPNDTTHEFTDLPPGTYYHICVYIEGSGEVVMSNVVVALTQPVRGEGDGDGGWPDVRPVDLAVFIASAAVVVAMAVHRIRRVRGEGKRI